MTEKPRISDDEIGSYRNFDALLEQHKAVRDGKVAMAKTNIWLSISFAALVMVSLFYLSRWHKPDRGELDLPLVETDLSEEVSMDQEPKSVPTTTENNKKPEQIVLKTIESKEGKNINSKKKTVKKEEAKPEAQQRKPQDSNKEYSHKTAEPKYGFPHLYEYFDKALQYPEEAIKDSIQGMVLVKFIIDKQGRPINIEISQSLGKLFDDEAISIIREMPPWKPATVNDVPVDSKMSIPLTFQIKK